MAQALAALSAGATSALMVLLAADHLEVGGGYGAMIAAIGVGAFVGPLLLTRLADRLRRPVVILGAERGSGVVWRGRAARSCPGYK